MDTRLATRKGWMVGTNQNRGIDVLNRQAGKIGYAILWLLGIPLPILLIVYLIRGH